MGTTVAARERPTNGFGSLRRRLLIAMIASLSASALMGIIVLLSGDIGEIEVRILVTTTATGAFSITALGASVRLERREAIPVGILGIGASGLALALALVGIWGELDGDGFYRAFGTVAVVAAAMAYASLALLVRPRHAAVRGILVATLGTLAVTAAMTIALILGADVEGDGYFRLLGSFAILTVFGTIVAPLLNRALDRS